MPTPPISPELAREALEAFERYGTKTAAAEALGLHVSTFTNRLNRAKIDPAIQESMVAVGTDMVPQLAWAKTKSEDGTSYSVLLKPSTAPEDMLDRIRAAFEGMTPTETVEPPEKVTADLCTVFPLMDVHFGMFAWGRETGDKDYDTKIAADDMRRALEKVLAITPYGEEALLIIGGDFFHMDDQRNETPGSKHKLDVDGRHFKVLDEGIRLVENAIKRIQSRHKRVTVRVLRGNHDIHSHLILTFALAERFRNDFAVAIEKEPRDLFMKQWGTSAIFAHHGDKGKPQQMALYLSDVCPFWSETRHRHLLTGHIHHDSSKDVGPLKWESLRAFCPPDSYAAGMGYASRRALQALTFHKTDGLVLRAMDPID